MRSSIYQVSKTKMEQADHLSNFDIAEYDYGKFGIDYVGDERNLEEGFNQMERDLPQEMFKPDIKNRCVTINRDNIQMILQRMVNTIRDKANALNENNILNWHETYLLKEAVMNYMGGNALFYYDGELMCLNNFIKDVANDETINTLYVGAMLDYHI